MTAEQSKLVSWFAFLDVITDSKDCLYDFQLGRNTIVSPAMPLINRGIELIEQIKEQTTDKVELAQIDILGKELRKYRQAVYIYAEEVSGGYRNGATAREMEVISGKAAEDIVQISLNVTEMIGHSVKDRSREIVKMTKTSQRILYVVLSLSALLTIVISIVMGRALARPIRKLATAAKKISDGDLSSRVEIDSHDEIGLLAAAFNNMAENVYQRSNELADSNKQLQQEVAVRKQTEKTLVKSMKDAEAANEAKSQFLANMSHEIRTPMNAIIGFGDLLANETLTDDQKYYVDTIRNSGSNLLAIINDILDFSKIEAGQLYTEFIECSLDGLLNSVESLMSATTTENGREFKITKSGSIPSRILTDPTRLRQCLINLIGNALKFTEEGYVHVNVSLKEKDSQPRICFAIEDTGIGIPKDKLAYIFDSFSQADDSHTRKFGGTGLGLAITKRLTDLLKGELDVVSEEGKGTTFTLTIPTGTDIIRQSSQESDNSAYDIETTISQFTGNVLIAEDDPTNQMLIKLLLEHLGLEVTVAEDGQEAIDKALECDFDLIFMDMQMPRMNGYEATIQLRQKGIETPIIALTANALKNDDKKCGKAGCDEYLTKPIEREKLQQTIARFLAVKETAIAGIEKSENS